MVATTCPPSRLPDGVNLFGITIHPVRLPEAAAQIAAWCGDPTDMCRLVVTPNVDHVVMLSENATFRAAYRAASLVVADGWPLVAASRWLGQPLPERVAGSDLVPAVFSAWHEPRPLSVYLLGAAPGVAARARRRIEARWPNVEVVRTESPPIGFESDPLACRRLIASIAAHEPDLLVVGLGAPKQECWLHAHLRAIRAKVAIAAGATIDFLAGHKRRAPRWVQQLRLEWFHRMLSEPRRLGPRYARDAWIFPRLVLREWRGARQRSASATR